MTKLILLWEIIWKWFPSIHILTQAQSVSSSCLRPNKKILINAEACFDPSFSQVRLVYFFWWTLYFLFFYNFPETSVWWKTHGFHFKSLFDSPSLQLMGFISNSILLSSYLSLSLLSVSLKPLSPPSQHHI
jgi:hypothetical protein